MFGITPFSGSPFGGLGVSTRLGSASISGTASLTASAVVTTILFGTR